MVREGFSTPIAELDHAHGASYSPPDANVWSAVPDTVGSALNELGARVEGEFHIPLMSGGELAIG